jgi:hypothetical protein
MGIKVYQLTQLGKRLARNTNSPDTPGWRVLHYLDSVHYATEDQVAMYSGLEDHEAANALGTLKRKGLIQGQ